METPNVTPVKPQGEAAVAFHVEKKDAATSPAAAAEGVTTAAAARKQQRSRTNTYVVVDWALGLTYEYNDCL